jgi:hypothetical protein
MKTNKLIYCTAAGAFLLTALSLKAVTVVSPDQQFALEVGNDLTIVDSSHQSVLTLAQNTAGDINIQVGWSPDSQRVIVVETSGRGSDIMAAWIEDGVWHRTIELDSDLITVIRQGKQALGGRYIADKRTLGGWISNTAIQVHGQMTFSGNRMYDYTYTLDFVNGPITLSPGGFEDGKLVGHNFQTL